jgi:hypothetical protein
MRWTLRTSIIVGIIGVLTLLAIIGFTYYPPVISGYINPNAQPKDPICSETPIECNIDDDCGKCIDSEAYNIKCTTLKRNSNQSKHYGEEKKYCLPEKPEKPCNEKLGGVWTWTGWASKGGEWDCMCTYPEIAGGNGCSKLNPNVCKGGKYTYSAIGADRGPRLTDCECPPTHIRIHTNKGIPMCIKKNKGSCPNEAICQSFYV